MSASQFERFWTVAYQHENFSRLTYRTFGEALDAAKRMSDEGAGEPVFVMEATAAVEGKEVLAPVRSV